MVFEAGDRRMKAAGLHIDSLHRSRWWLAIGCIALLGFILRLAAIDGESFWYDEAVSVSLAAEFCLEFALRDGTRQWESAAVLGPPLLRRTASDADRSQFAVAVGGIWHNDDCGTGKIDAGRIRQCSGNSRSRFVFHIAIFARVLDGSPLLSSDSAVGSGKHAVFHTLGRDTSHIGWIRRCDHTRFGVPDTLLRDLYSDRSGAVVAAVSEKRTAVDGMAAVPGSGRCVGSVLASWFSKPNAY